MRRPKFDSRLTAYTKRKRLLKFAEGTSLELASTKFAEWILVDKKRTEGDVLHIKMYYMDGTGIYHAYLKGVFEKDALLIGDVGVLEGEGYAPKGKPPYGKGYGSALMRTAINECYHRGITKVYGKRKFLTPEQDKRQLNYYKSYDFAIDPQGRIFLELGPRFHLISRDNGRTYEEV
ncbi:GNAT family N-acetyltransferase [Planococcus beigongshangi]|uniref:GNAT family N-acetyltransferase n=1 Tax=Planococcus beigongshangi TaxID=2782536 RepID=UPI00193B199E|nr:GNAT family N-acetyltransferase [Planococcus beigongshangi]